jgi:pimeloyl-ACP methyl ester carboxylesterase
MRTMLLAFLVVLGIGLLGVVGSALILTSLVIYYAPPKAQPSPAEFDRIASQALGPIEKVRYPSEDGVDLVAWYLPAQVAQGSEHWGVILTHGGGDNKSTYLDLAELLRQQGFDVMLPDLRGHGESARSPNGLTLGITEGRDVAAAANFLVTAKGVTHIAAHGVSMGGVSAVMAASLDPRIGPLILESSSDQARRVTEMALHTIGVPAGAITSAYARGVTSLLLRRMGAPWSDCLHAILPTRYLAKALSPRPVLFVFGDRDPLVRASDVASFAGQFSGATNICQFKDVAHGVYPARHDEFAQLILNFLNGWRHMPDSPLQAPVQSGTDFDCSNGNAKPL